MTDDHSHADDLGDLLDRAQGGDASAFNEIFAVYRERLKRMVVLRLDRRLQGRIDASDVIQEAYVDALRGLDGYRAAPRVSPFLWLRYLVAMRLKELHRHHLGTRQRDARLDVSIFPGPLPQADSAALAAQLLGRLTSPSHAALRAEKVLKLQQALLAMEPIDREILALRHFEDLSRAESAAELGIEEGAAGKRYLRALQRLRRLLHEEDLS